MFKYLHFPILFLPPETVNILDLCLCRKKIAVPIKITKWYKLTLKKCS